MGGGQFSKEEVKGKGKKKTYIAIKKKERKGNFFENGRFKRKRNRLLGNDQTRKSVCNQFEGGKEKW